MTQKPKVSSAPFQEFVKISGAITLALLLVRVTGILPREFTPGWGVVLAPLWVPIAIGLGMFAAGYAADDD